MLSTTATLGEGFSARIEYDVDEDGEVEDVKVFSAETGQDLTDLLCGSKPYEQAWDAAERFAASMPPTLATRRAAANDMAAMCSGTPFAYGVAA